MIRSRVSPAVSFSGEEGIHLLGDFLHHRGHHVRIGIEGYADLVMAKLLLDELRVNSLSEKKCGAGVAKVVEAGPGKTRFL